MNFSDRLKELRYINGNILQTELANAVGISKSAVSSYEKQGKNSPNLDILIKFTYYFDVSVDYLSGITDNKFSIKNNIIQLPLDITLEKYDLIKKVADDIVKS